MNLPFDIQRFGGNGGNLAGKGISSKTDQSYQPTEYEKRLQKAQADFADALAKEKAAGAPQQDSAYPAVFGNAMTLQEAQAANPADAGSLESLRQQYKNDQAALVAAAVNAGKAKNTSTGVSIPVSQIVRSMPYEQALPFFTNLFKNQGTQTGTKTTAQSTLEEAQNAADRSLNQYHR